jgi:hypothetical protein
MTPKELLAALAENPALLATLGSLLANQNNQKTGATLPFHGISQLANTITPEQIQKQIGVCALIFQVLDIAHFIVIRTAGSASQTEHNPLPALTHSLPRTPNMSRELG